MGRKRSRGTGDGGQDLMWDRTWALRAVSGGNESPKQPWSLLDTVERCTIFVSTACTPSSIPHIRHLLLGDDGYSIWRFSRPVALAQVTSTSTYPDAGRECSRGRLSSMP